jgi:predicted SnoaL-like aldol condensation-catalyzing enzyme
MTPNDELLCAYVEVWNEGAVGRLHEMLAPTYDGHMRGSVFAERDAESLGSSIADFRRRFPAVRFAVIEQIMSGDRVASRLSAVLGGEEVAIGMNFSRWQDGRLAEEWALWEPMP